MKNIGSVIDNSYKKREGDLYAYYKEALKDEKFKKLVAILIIDSKILM